MREIRGSSSQKEENIPLLLSYPPTPPPPSPLGILDTQAKINANQKTKCLKCLPSNQQVRTLCTATFETAGMKIDAIDTLLPYLYTSPINNNRFHGMTVTKFLRKGSITHRYMLPGQFPTRTLTSSMAMSLRYDDPLIPSNVNWK